MKVFKRIDLNLLVLLVSKQLKVRYKSTYLGVLWVLINPLLQVLVLLVVLTVFLKLEVKNYALFLVAGLYPWMFFQQALNSSTKSILDNRMLIKTCQFSRVLIPLSMIISELVIFLISSVFVIAALMVGFGLTQHYFFIPNVPVFVLALVLETFLLVGISLITSSLEVYYRDVAFLVQAVLPIWFYITPIIYQINMVPKSLLSIYSLNPLVGIINLFQFSLKGINTVDFRAVVVSILITSLIGVVGIIVFKKKRKDLADWL